MKHLLLASVFLAILISHASAQRRRKTLLGNRSDIDDSDESRDARFMSLFHIVRFKADECEVNGNTGICLREDQCSQDRGRAIGHCASGFGICCQHIITTSNSRVTKNGTLVQNPEYPAPLATTNIPFMYMVSDIADDVCFIRIDFIRSELREDLELITAAPIREDDCIDKLEIVEGNAAFVGIFCGTMNGQHMYLDAGGILDREEIMVSQTFVGDFDRTFRHKISYIHCGKSWTPDPGCRQFFMGVAGTVDSYNFAGKYHLNLMAYTTCIRQEKGYCGVIWTPSFDSGLVDGVDQAFELSDNVATIGLAGDIICQSDFLIIENSRNWGDEHPCSVLDLPITQISDITAASARNRVDRYCGGRLNCIANYAGPSTRGSIVSDRFRISLNADQRDRSDNGNNLVNDVGYMLDYRQNPC